MSAGGWTRETRRGRSHSRTVTTGYTATKPTAAFGPQWDSGNLNSSASLLQLKIHFAHSRLHNIFKAADKKQHWARPRPLPALGLAPSIFLAKSEVTDSFKVYFVSAGRSRMNEFLKSPQNLSKLNASVAKMDFLSLRMFSLAFLFPVMVDTPVVYRHYRKKRLSGPVPASASVSFLWTERIW